MMTTRLPNRLPRHLLLVVALAAAVPAGASNRLISAGGRVSIARTALTVEPASEWNRLGARPGRNAEVWTLDGDTLNALTFYAAIGEGKTLFRQADRREHPLPPVNRTMLLTDIPTLLENSYRSALDVATMTIDHVEPTPFAGAGGVHFSYTFVRPEEAIHVRGEGFGTLRDGKLYLITYEAPALYYFERSAAAARQVAESARLD